MNYCHIEKTNRVEKVLITDHAGFDEGQNDIVCAGISALAFTIAQQILRIDETFDLRISQEDAVFEFKNNLQNEQVDLLLETLLTGLQMMATQYPQYISVEENTTEV